jgi:hypothetical protein
MTLAWWLVPCLPFPGLPHIYFLFTVRLRIFHVCCNENFHNRYLSFYWKKWFYVWYMAFAWWIVLCLPFQVYCTSTSCLPCDLEFFMFAVMKIFITDISASTGRNDFIFDIWLLHGDLYRVSPFQVTVITTFFSLWLHKSLLCTFQPVYNDLYWFIMICAELDVSD